jgi:hypothetical protein
MNQALTTQPSRHPFLDDLAPGVVLSSNVLMQPLCGRENVLRVVELVGKIYRSQEPTYLKEIDPGRSLFEYEADLAGGRRVHGVVVIDRNPAGEVIRLNIGFSPMAGAQSIAVRLGEAMEAQPDQQSLS